MQEIINLDYHSNRDALKLNFILVLFQLFVKLSYIFAVFKRWGFTLAVLGVDDSLPYKTKTFFSRTQTLACGLAFTVLGDQHIIQPVKRTCVIQV